MHRRLLLASLFIVVLSVGSYFSLNQSPKLTVDIRKVTGLPLNVSGNSIEIDGAYSGAYIPEELQSRRKLSFRTDENTVFKKQEIQMPPLPKLGPNSSSSRTYQLKDLPMTEGVGSLEDLKMKVAAAAETGDINVGSIYLQATFAEPIQDLAETVASEVFYKVFVELSLQDE